MSNINKTILSFVLMLVVWTMLFQSWQFAMAFLVLLGIHEMGHYVVARALGMNVTMPIFTPIGAMINLQEEPQNAWDEALMAFGGPFLGTLGAIGALVVGYSMDSAVIIMAAKAGFWLNLFNLIPLSPLDGGRISMAINRHLWVLGALLLAGVIYLTGFDLFTVLILFLISNWAYADVKYRSAKAIAEPAYFAIGAGRRVGMIGAYVALIGFLLFALMAL